MLPSGVGNPGDPLHLAWVLAWDLHALAHAEARRLIGSTLHWRPMVNGYASFFPPEYPETIEVLNRFPEPPALARVAELRVRYVVVELGAMGREAQARTRAALAVPLPGVVQAAVLDDTVIYELTGPGEVRSP